ncbi:MAG TPA: response regulator [Saprospiraceae bacterium]|nr:response regulator [Saprospiraceae bacterium]
MKKKVLCIEQNHSLGFVIKTVLSESFLVKVVPNAFDAMDELIKDDTNCIILAVEKENKQSLNFLQHLRSSSLLKNTPVVVISDYDDNFLREICQQSNISKIYRKPFDPLRLLDTVQSLCSTVDTSQVLFENRKILNLN